MIHYFHFDGGKYTLVFNDTNGAVTALRYGAPWQDFVGNNLMYFIACELVRLRGDLQDANERAKRD